MKKRLKTTILFILFFIIFYQCINAKADIQIDWEKRYTLSSENKFYDIIELENGSIATVGSILSENNDLDIWFSILSDKGSLYIEKQLAIPKLNNGGYSILEVSDGFIISADSQTENGEISILVIKISPKGELIWYNSTAIHGNEHGRKIIQASDGSFIIAGYSDSISYNNNNFLLLKIDDYGNILWYRLYSEPGSSKAFSVTETPEGGFLLVGENKYIDSGKTKALVIKTNKKGIKEWSKSYGVGEYNSAKSVIKTKDSNYAILAETFNRGPGKYDFWLVKINSLGNEIWNRTYGERDEEGAKDLYLLNDGFLLTGYSNYNISYDPYIVKTNFAGYKQFSSNVFGLRDEILLSAHPTKNNSIVLTGIDSGLNYHGIFISKTKKINFSRYQNTYPTIDAGPDLSASIGEEVSFSVESFDFDGEIINYEWDFDGDGAYDWQSQSTSTVTHQYQQNGVYHAYVKVTDNNDTSSIDEKIITVGTPQTQDEIKDKAYITTFILIFIVLTILLFIVDRKINFRKYLSQRIPKLSFIEKINVYVWYLSCSFVVIIIIKYILSYYFYEPTIYYDEHSYLSIAANINQGKLMFVGSLTDILPVSHPYPAGYSYFITPAYSISGANIVLTYRIVLFINALLTTLLMIPTFLIMKRFVSKKLALISAIIIPTIPIVISHGYFAMSENAFYLVFTISCYLVIKTFEHDSFDKKFIIITLLTGIAVGSLIFIKATGVAIFIALLGVFLFKIIVNRNKTSLKYLIPILSSLPFIIYALIGRGTDILGYNFESYIGRVNQAVSIGDNLIRFIEVSLNELAYLGLMSFFVFFIFSIFLIFFFKKIKIMNKTVLSAFILFSLLTILFLLGLTVNHIFTGKFSIYTRYLSPGLITLYMLGFIGIDIFRKHADIDIAKKLILISTISFIFILIAFPFEDYNLANNLDLYWIKSIGKSSFLYLKVLLGGIGLPIFSYILYKYATDKELIKKVKKYKKKPNFKLNMKKYYKIAIGFFCAILIIQMILYLPTHSIVVEKQEELIELNYNGVGLWFMQNDPEASVIMEDYYNAYSGMSFDHNNWYYLYANMRYYMPYNSIEAVNVTVLNQKINSDDMNADYLVSTHELRDMYKRVAVIDMPIEVEKPKRQSTASWYIYKLN